MTRHKYTTAATAAMATFAILNRGRDRALKLEVLADVGSSIIIDMEEVSNRSSVDGIHFKDTTAIYLGKQREPDSGATAYEALSLAKVYSGVLIK